MKKLLILEDNEVCSKTLETIVKTIDERIMVYTADNTGDAYKIIMENQIDMFLVDIILDTSLPNDASGLVFAENMRRIDKYKFVPLIFITALEDPQLYAFKELHCYGYIHKPFLEDKIKVLIKKALEYRGPDDDRSIYFRKNGIFYSKKIKDIVYIESKTGKMIIKTTDDELEIYHRSINSILSELDSDNFIKCSRGVIVNRKYIDMIDGTNRYIHLKNDYGTIEIGTVMKKKFLNKVFDENTQDN